MDCRGSIAVSLSMLGAVMLGAGPDQPQKAADRADRSVKTTLDAPADDGGIAGSGFSIVSNEVASGLTLPVYCCAPPGDTSRLFILEKGGRIRILDLNTMTLQSTGNAFLDIQSTVGGGTSTNDERGLLGMAFHPDYASNRFFYLYYTNNSNNTVVARYQTQAGDPDSADTGSSFTIMNISQPQTNHNGGWMEFGPLDGYLYIATGDGGNFNDQGSGHSSGGNAQDITNNLLGKILRIDVDGGSPYDIPSDNPFVGVSGDDEIWCYGLRNPWRNNFDAVTGDLYIADVGQFAWEEISFQPGSSAGGENYGWRCMEGNHCTGLSGCTCNAGSLTDAIQEYSHASGRCSITGGIMYRGAAIPAMQGTYFYADWCSDDIWSFRYDGLNVTEFTDRTSELDPDGSDTIVDIASFGTDANGEIYICEHSGRVYRIEPGALTNDICAGASLTNTADTPFSNVGGNTDGTSEAGCPTFQSDVWYRYIATCEGTLDVSVCDATFDTVVAVYSACPTGNDEALACNNDDCGTGSSVSVPVTIGLYYVRIGSADGSQGTGTLHIECVEPSCLGDGNQDGTVNSVDLLALLAAWGGPSDAYDLNNDEVVDSQDLLAMLALWGPCP